MSPYFDKTYTVCSWIQKSACYIIVLTRSQQKVQNFEFVLSQIRWACLKHEMTKWRNGEMTKWRNDEMAK